jgi:exosortase
MTELSPSLTRWRDLPWLARLPLLLLAAALLALSIRLWPEWRQNPDLSHGMFMPVVFVLLVIEARRGTRRFIRRGVGSALACTALLALAVGALVAAGLYAAAVDWSHPLVNGMLALSAVALLGAALVVYAGESVRLVGLNWNAFIAVVLWLWCTTIPPGTYSRLTLALQLWVSESTLRTLHLLGIAAIRHGNIIELARATVGVEEACSGVRSLISCVFAGLFFSATLVRRPWARAVIIALSAPLALLMNFLRSLTLTLVANSGTDIAGAWHDVTGFAVLGVTAVLLGALAYLLGRHSADEPAVAAASARPVRAPLGPLVALAGTLVLSAVLVALAIDNTRPSMRGNRPVPDLDALLPETASGWHVTTTNDLYQFRDTLQTDHLAQRIYRRPNGDGTTTEVILYLAYWQPGQAPVSLVASHTPDACWPGSGWTAKPVTIATAPLRVDHRTLPSAEYRLFTFGDFPQHVWFWHLYDRRPITFLDPYSPAALLRIAWRYGFRHDGDQLFVRVSSNRPWSEFAADPLLAEFFRRLEPLGI